MNLAASSLVELRAFCGSEDASLMRAVINAVSTAEAGISLGLLTDRVPERTLVAALNMREMMRELPETPFQMRVDFAMLERIAGLLRNRSSWVLAVDGAGGPLEIELLGQGNLVYDIGIRDGEQVSLLKPGPIGGDFVRPCALDIMLSNEILLRAVIDLMKDMGMVLNPRFYLSIEDWQMEHAAESLGRLSDLF
jgi:hypothetical protein